jgi:membrane protein
MSGARSLAGLRPAAKALAQRLVFCFERFGEHELANHSAAGAYAFLLSAMPAVLLALGLASALLRANPAALAAAERAASSLLGAMEAADAVKAFFGRPLGGLAAAIGALSLLYSARLLAVAIQRGLRVVWAASGKLGLVRANLLGFLLELLTLLAVLAILAASAATSFVAGALGSGAGKLLGGALRIVSRAAPPAVLLAFVYMNYRLASADRPPRRTAFAAALLCVLATVALSGAFGLFMGSARYNLLYGIFGNLVVLLANVYSFFCLFFFGAELVYVEGRLDALLFARFQRCLRSPAARAERALFGQPERLIRRFGRTYAEGEQLFTAGEAGTEAYCVQRGKVGIYMPQAGGELRLATVETGEIFGEMALLKGEARSASARADADSLVLVIPREVFELYLSTDGDAARRLAELLSDRLRTANRRLGSISGQGLPPSGDPPEEEGSAGVRR